jgi:hypothetical protein
MDALKGRQRRGGDRVGVLRILGPSGDARVAWDATDADQVADVRKRFDEIIRDGYLVFELDARSKEGTQIRTFDPAATELRAFRPLAGG